MRRLVGHRCALASSDDCIRTKPLPTQPISAARSNGISSRIFTIAFHGPESGRQGDETGTATRVGTVGYSDAKCRLLEGDGPDATERSHECIGQSCEMFFQDFQREFLIRYANVHITPNLKLLSSGARQHLVDARSSILFRGTARRPREQRHAARFNCRPGTCKLKLPAGPRGELRHDPMIESSSAGPCNLAAIRGALPVDGRAHR